MLFVSPSSKVCAPLWAGLITSSALTLTTSLHPPSDMNNVNTLKHYTCSYSHCVNISCSVTLSHESDQLNRYEVRKTPSDSTSDRWEIEYALGLPVRLWWSNSSGFWEPEEHAPQELWLLKIQEKEREDYPTRIRICIRPNSPSGWVEDGTSERAYSCNGEGSREAPDLRRRGTPLERYPVRQSTGESGAMDKESASGGESKGQGDMGEAHSTPILPRSTGGDPVNHPSHYTSSPSTCECGRFIECIQITEHMGFCLGNAIKYIWRADLKNDAIEDLEKAQWYIAREIEKRKKQTV